MEVSMKRKVLVAIGFAALTAVLAAPLAAHAAR